MNQDDMNDDGNGNDNVIVKVVMNRGTPCYFFFQKNTSVKKEKNQIKTRKFSDQKKQWMYEWIILQSIIIVRYCLYANYGNNNHI